ncbi:ArsR/SmtB family transcription factor [Rhodovulum sp. YNF3179]|uniref:ArsR/SmtB family transcription factor n=1 Tax=Rhodovulum sp. YNF3179 TaxID=3425127 RepID=UPI003D3516A7
MPLDQDPNFSDEMFEQANEAAALMKSLSNPGRLMTLCLLIEGEKSVAELADRLGTKQPNVSQQLARLRLEGLVAPRRDGRTIYYSIADERVRPVLEGLHAAFCPQQ